MDLRRTRTRPDEAGQSVAELALTLPILLVLLLAVGDVARVYTTMLTIESAAREAADYGAYNSANWIGDASDSTSNHAKTLAAMTERACVASRHLPGYSGSGTSCTNPLVAISLRTSGGAPASGCDDPQRTPEPCRVRVDLSYRFDLITPATVEVVGLPSSLTFTRTSIFAISDFEADPP